MSFSFFSFCFAPLLLPLPFFYPATLNTSFPFLCSPFLSYSLVFFFHAAVHLLSSSPISCLIISCLLSFPFVLFPVLAPPLHHFLSFISSPFLYPHFGTFPNLISSLPFFNSYLFAFFPFLSLCSPFLPFASSALCDMHPMRALFLIPRNPAPRLKSKKW